MIAIKFLVTLLIKKKKKEREIHATAALFACLQVIVFQYEMKKIPSQDCMVGDAYKIIEIRS